MAYYVLFAGDNECTLYLLSNDMSKMRSKVAVRQFAKNFFFL